MLLLFILHVKTGLTNYIQQHYYILELLITLLLHVLRPRMVLHADLAGWHVLVAQCFNSFPQADLHSLSLWFLHSFALYIRQIPDRSFFLSVPGSFFTWLLAALVMPLLVFQLIHTWLSSSVVRNACEFSQLSPFLLNT